MGLRAEMVYLLLELLLLLLCLCWERLIGGEEARGRGRGPPEGCRPPAGG